VPAVPPPGKLAVPGVGHLAPPAGELLTPGVGRGRPPGPGGVLPLDLGGKQLAGPLRVGQRVLIRHVHDRVPFQPGQAAGRPAGMAPVGARHPLPPALPVVQRDRPLCRLEDQRARHQVGRVGAGEVRRVWRPLGGGDPAGAGDETVELGVGHRVLVDPERAGRPLVGRAFLRVLGVTAHQEPPGRRQHHVLAGRLPGAGRDVGWLHGRSSRLIRVEAGTARSQAAPPQGPGHFALTLLPVSEVRPGRQGLASPPASIRPSPRCVTPDG
jgi:hypothetical protein